jgi:DNA-binding MarR family transcriptional regulator
MNALDLFLLGRRLAKIGEASFPRRNGSSRPAGLLLTLEDALTHPGTSIGEIVSRTGLPQSYVSASVARLRTAGVVATQTDPQDGRRTLVQRGPAVPGTTQRMAAVSIDASLAKALGDVAPEELARTLEALDWLADRLLARRRQARAVAAGLPDQPAMSRLP